MDNKSTIYYTFKNSFHIKTASMFQVENVFYLCSGRTYSELVIIPLYNLIIRKIVDLYYV